MHYERSTLGRFLRQRLGLTTADYAQFLEALLALLISQGFLTRLDPLDNHQFYQLDAACLLWRLGDGSPPPPDPIYSRRASSAGYVHTVTPVNTFFQRFYRASSAALAAMEGARTQPPRWSRLANVSGASAVFAGRTATPARRASSAAVCPTWSARPRWSLA